MKVTVKVTAEMGDPTRKGVSFMFCMVDQAITPLLAEGFRAYTTNDRFSILRVADEAGHISFSRDDPTFYLPEEECERIERWDEREKIPAHEFAVDIPDQYLRDPKRKKKGLSSHADVRED